MTTNPTNPCGLQGIEFAEFTGPEPQRLGDLFSAFGFSRVLKHRELPIDSYQQNAIHFLVNADADGFAAEFGKLHGPSLCSMGWRVEDAELALKTAVERGARPYEGQGPYGDAPAIYGIGDSLIYFIDGKGKSYLHDFIDHPQPTKVEDKGFIVIDHLTNNVEKGTMATWAKFYKEIFGFTEVRYFDIRGAKTGLTSYALRSPDGSFCIPINEGSEEKSQIEEYLREYRGPGIQHLAFLSRRPPGQPRQARGLAASRPSTSTTSTTRRSSSACPTSLRTASASRTSRCSSTATRWATCCRSSPRT